MFGQCLCSSKRGRPTVHFFIREALEQVAHFFVLLAICALREIHRRVEVPWWVSQFIAQFLFKQQFLPYCRLIGLFSLVTVPFSISHQLRLVLGIATWDSLFSQQLYQFLDIRIPCWSNALHSLLQVSNSWRFVRHRRNYWLQALDLSMSKRSANLFTLFRHSFSQGPWFR